MKFLVGPLGADPRLTDYESEVLPLNYRPDSYPNKDINQRFLESTMDNPIKKSDAFPNQPYPR